MGADRRRSDARPSDEKAGNGGAVPDLVVVGSIGFDSIETPRERREGILGGSVSYACLAARFYARTGMVGVVGRDFDERHIRGFRRGGVDVSGLERRPGLTFRWSGVYETDLNQRSTRSTELNVFADFDPVLPETYRSAPFLFLANIAPALQWRVLRQARSPRLVLVDTMDLWIETARDELREVIGAAHVLTLNESEARHLTGRPELPAAARELCRWGPRWVIVKKGEHGSLLYGPRGFFYMPAFPLEQVADPTGAGDAFAGGFMGYLAARGRVSEADLRRAMGHGAVVASFAVERFGIERLQRLRRVEIERRYDALRRMTQLG
jgi:sugar/nucleoside kinase (ribokinase family)